MSTTPPRPFNNLSAKSAQIIKCLQWTLIPASVVLLVSLIIFFPLVAFHNYLLRALFATAVYSFVIGIVLGVAGCSFFIFNRYMWLCNHLKKLYQTNDARLTRLWRSDDMLISFWIWDFEQMIFPEAFVAAPVTPAVDYTPPPSSGEELSGEDWLATDLPQS